MKDTPTIEAEVRHQIDTVLKAQGWVLDHNSDDQNVFFEGAVLRVLPTTYKNRLGILRPDYTLFCGRDPVAIIEAKKPAVSAQDALKQATKYAAKIDVDYVFACNGPVLKTLHIPSGKPLSLNGVEVSDLMEPGLLYKFRREGVADLVTDEEEVAESKEQLIRIFSKINEELRRAGVRAGLDRFSEFANLLFLKILGEKKGGEEIWHELRQKPEKDLPAYLNNYAIKKLRKDFGSDVLLETTIEGKHLKQIINELSPLRLSGVDEDVKGTAFEFFLGGSASSSNDLGEYFTPRNVVRFMVKASSPKLGSKILDPFCGTGGFLIEAFKQLGQQASSSKEDQNLLRHESLYGQELTKNARIAKMNMILFGDGHSNVEQKDSMKPGTFRLVNHILTNIPFSLGLDKNTIRKIDIKAGDSDAACFLKCFNSLRRGGGHGCDCPRWLDSQQKTQKYVETYF